MLAKHHQISSVAIGVAGLTMLTTPLTTPLASASFLAAVYVGALLPDVDHANSTISKIIKIPFYKVLKHRGATHGWLGWLVFTGLLYGLFHALFLFTDLGSNQFVTVALTGIWLGLSFGYLLHLLEDSWSRAGIRWLAPFSGYDKYAYSHYQQLLRKPVRYGKHKGKKYAIRHWWGRGYEVGSGTEIFIMWLLIGMALLTVIRWGFLHF